MIGVRLEDGTWIGNLHASGRGDAEVQRAGRALRAWADDSPAVLGGDFNLRRPQLPGFEYVGGVHVDHVLARGLHALAPAEVLDRGRLSDHAPVAVSLAG